MTEIQKFAPCHVRAAAEIERLSFSSPWSEESLVLLCGGYGNGFALLCDGRLAAYAGMTSVLDEGEIVTVATHPDLRRRGYAREVLLRLIGYAQEQGITTLTLEVRESNAAAQALYSSLGFVTVGKRRGFYSDPREDALIMNRYSGGVSDVDTDRLERV